MKLLLDYSYKNLSSKLLATFLLMTIQFSSYSQENGSYAIVNGMRMYYEIHGKGTPIVLLHGGGSTLDTTFGTMLPLLSKTHQVIGVELQAHGRTADRDRPSTFEQDADDVAELLKQLKVNKADIFGFSNGGNTAMQIAIRHPQIVRKLIVASSFYKRSGMAEGFWDFMKRGTFADLPEVYKEAFLKVNPSKAGLLAMYKRDSARMLNFQDWNDSSLQSITAKTLVVIGDQDVVRSSHAMEMARLIPGSRLAILPGGHGSYLGEILSVDTKSKIPDLFVEMINEFLTE